MYTRGSPQIYDAWQKAREHRLGLRRRATFSQNGRKQYPTEDKIDPGYHGFDGPMHI
ncbi:hypothetical protein U1Q18_051346, partial [Sarracenia purpurea var. burkii]